MTPNFIFKLDESKAFLESPSPKDVEEATKARSIESTDDLSVSSAKIVKQYETDIRDCACVLVELGSLELAAAILSRIREHTDPRVYLSHVVFIEQNERNKSNEQAKSDLLKHSFDHALVKDQYLEEKISRLEPEWVATQNWLSTLPNIADGLQDTSLRFKILRFFASRNLTIEPLKTIHNKRGYIFAPLRAFTNNEDLSIDNALEFLENQQLLTASFIEKTHACGNCESVFLNFKETCPDCRSSNIIKEELLHHFHCGHIDNFDAYKRSNQLVCPKCDRDLKHLGVDYDKPSTVHKCITCSLSFQEPHVEAQCFACGRNSDIQDLLLKNVQAFSSTSIGMNAAVFGLDALFTQILQTDLQLYSHQELKHYIKLEQARIERYKKSVSTLGCIYLRNLDQLYNQLGKKTEQLFKELSAVFKSVFRESDMISARNESVFAVVMTETDLNGSHLAMQRLEQAISNLFDDSLDYRIEIKTGFFDISEVHDLELVLERFMSDES